MTAPMPVPHRFRSGDTVVVAAREAVGHCRTPWYLRGRTGVVAAIHGAFHDPERLAYHKAGLPLKVLYKVRFLQSDLWPGYHGPPSDHLEADIYEHWLDPADGREASR
jgi:nitrile hydratase subunit beta